MHGGTVHGTQRRSRDVSVRSLPLAYYYPAGPIGQVFESYTGTSVVDRVAIIGLGVGSLAAYGVRGREFTFFEIDPGVVRIAQSGLFPLSRRLSRPGANRHGRWTVVLAA